MNNIAKYKDFTTRKLGERSLLQKQLSEAEEHKVHLTNRAKAIIEAQTIIQKIAVETQTQLRFKIEDIVNKILETTFPDYTFELEYEVKRGKSEANLKFFKCGHEIDPMDNDGGGITDVCTIALRLAIWSLSDTRPLLILDEATKHLSAQDAPRFAEVFSTLAKELSIQVVLPSHSDAIKAVADTVYEVGTKRVKDIKWPVSQVKKVV
jgi:DNA repair exonuclease SbcCD ATPase subunit